MNATKRKFNALLNGIGNKSTTSLSSTELNSTNTMNTEDSNAKKRRVIVLSSDTRRMPSTNPKSVAASNHKKSATMATPTASTESPKYAPWDRTQFLKRLKSFSNLTDWTPKPARVNEVEWAKRGWVCQKSERVRCCLCNVEILVKLNKKEVDGKELPVYIPQNIEDALVDKYVELIVTSHNEDCLWRQRGCDDSIFKLPLNHPATTTDNLRTRYDELLTRSESLPYSFNMRAPPDFDLDTVLSYLPPGFFASSTNTAQQGSKTTEVNKVAFLMALFGWQGHTHERLGNQVGSVSCHACFRVLGLWIFKSKQVDEAGNETAGAVMNRLDLVKQHREYCPWQNPASQNGKITTAKTSTSSMAGWEIVVKNLKNDHYLRTSKEPQQAKPRSPEATRESEESDGDDARSIRDEKDKERWARLRRVKSLFETKGGKKLNRSNTTGKTPVPNI